MRIVIDQSRCQGHARCAAVAPDLYPLNDEGYLAIDGFEPTPEQEPLARRGARACPERIIRVDEAG